jgi:hypothetical protein
MLRDPVRVVRKYVQGGTEELSSCGAEEVVKRSGEHRYDTYPVGGSPWPWGSSERLGRVPRSGTVNDPRGRRCCGLVLSLGTLSGEAPGDREGGSGARCARAHTQAFLDSATWRPSPPAPGIKYVARNYEDR